MSDKRTEISQIGEFGLINKLCKGIQTKQKSTVLGIGDDSCVLDFGDKYCLLSSDMMIENIHFDLSYFPLKHLGYKLVSVNVSDIVAMNGKPSQILINVAASNRFSVEALEVLYEGIKEACTYYSVDIVGGDTCSSEKGLVLSATIVGSMKKEKYTARSGAKPNDIVCISGPLGEAYLGLQVLRREKQVYLENPNMQPEISEFKGVIQKQLSPFARTDIVEKLDELEVVPTSMIDISDGLASEVLHIAKQSDVGISLFEDKIPISNDVKSVSELFGLNPFVCAFNGGEDYELLFTIDQKNFDKIDKIDGIHCIGYVGHDPNDVCLITNSNEKIRIEAQGWKHF